MHKTSSTAPILLVEDNPDNRQLASWILEDAGYAIEEAETAECGLQLLDDKAFSLVLMDISLPGMDGKEATRTIRQNPNYGTMPIIALTAHAIESEWKSIMASGANAIVTKPIDEDALIGKIQELISAR